jgi:hypothetical protein
MSNFDDYCVYVGFDSSNFGQMMAYETCRKSILRFASKPIEVRQLIKNNLIAKGDFKRIQTDGSTEFTYTRFLVPFLNNYKGWALFCDSDFLWLDDVWKLLDYAKADPDKAVYCVQHNIESTHPIKMNGLVQENYPRKNWSSLLLFNCSHTSLLNLYPESIAVNSPSYLHRLHWALDTEIGSLPHTYNYLVGYYDDCDYDNLPKAIHYTDGGPWHPTYECVKFGDLWLAYLSLDECTKLFAEREQLRKDMKLKLLYN